MREKLKKYDGEIYRGLLSLLTLVLFLSAGNETERIAPIIVAGILLLCVGLIVLPRTRYLNLPFLLLTLMVLPCYDSAATFMKYIWVAPFALAALAFHIVRLRPRLRAGPTLLPLVAVAIATMLAGIGMITPGEYFRLSALGHVIGLGPGLVFAYWIMKSEATEEADAEGLFSDLFWWALTAAAAVLCTQLPAMLQTGSPLDIQWSNNVATMMMIALPAVMLKGKRHPILLILSPLVMVGIFLSGSRGGLVFVPIEFICCFLWVLFSEKNKTRRLIYTVLSVVTAGVFIAAVIYLICNPEWIVNIGGQQIYNPDEIRWKMLRRGLEDFRANPLFGAGLGYVGNADLHNGVQGTINWYHIFPVQIIGGLGICGILAWGWQLFCRFILSMRSIKTDTFVLPLCYLGLLLMSMVNPGEFCPAPYAFLTVYFYAVTENRLLGVHRPDLLLSVVHQEGRSIS